MPPAGPSYARAVDRVEQATADCPVVVFDLDGVIREFSAFPATELDRELGLPEGGWYAAAFGHPHLSDVVTGRITFAQWHDRIARLLLDDGADPDLVAGAMARWLADRGRPVAPTVDLIERIRSGGRDTFVFTNGTDNVPAELRQIGLGHLLDGLLNSADFGVAKPDPDAYAAAHAVIERTLRRSIDRAEIGFTDDRIANVEAAAGFGWTTVHFTT